MRDCFNSTKIVDSLTVIKQIQVVHLILIHFLTVNVCLLVLFCSLQ